MRDTVDATYMDAIYSDEGGWLGGGFRQAEVKADGTIALTADGNMLEDKMFPDAGNHGLITTGQRGGAAATPGGPLSASVVRRIVAHFRSLGVRPMADGYYVGLVTPEVALQLREDSATEGANGWRYPHLDGSWNGSILNGTIGIFEGVRFIEGPQFKGLDKGDEVAPGTNNIINVAPTDGHNLLFIGSEGICDVTVETPHTTVTPTTDRFGRLLAWAGLELGVPGVRQQRRTACRSRCLRRTKCLRWASITRAVTPYPMARVHLLSSSQSTQEFLLRVTPVAGTWTSCLIVQTTPPALLARCRLDQSNRNTRRGRAVYERPSLTMRGEKCLCLSQPVTVVPRLTCSTRTPRSMQLFSSL